MRWRALCGVVLAVFLLPEVGAGERARCHCVALKGGKHYSQQLLLEKK